MIINKLIRLANKLDELGFEEEADYIDSIISGDDPHRLDPSGEYDDIQEDYDQPVVEHDELEYIEPEEDSVEKFFGSWTSVLPEVSKLLAKRRLHGKDEFDVARYYESEIEGNDILSKFEWAGSGAFRIALSPIGSPGYIIKFARELRGAKMNKSEFDKQQDFKGLFAEVYGHGAGGHGTDFDWIIFEKVNIIETNEEVSAFFPEITDNYNNLSRSGQVGIQTALRYLLQIGVANDDLPNEDMNSRQHQVEGFKKIFNESPRWWLEDLKSNELFSKLVAVSKELGIDVNDLGVGNLGVNKKGDLVVVDASLSEDFRTSEKKIKEQFSLASAYLI